MTEANTPLEELLCHLERLANAALALWDVPADATARLINVSENATYLVEACNGYKAILRVHRESYHTRRAIECELAWLDALTDAETVTTPGYYTGKDGEAIQEAIAEGLSKPRFLVLFHFVEGVAPDESGDMSDGYEELGVIAARCHSQVLVWQKPPEFERLTWDVDTVFGLEPTWGNWRDGPEVTDNVLVVLEKVEATIRSRLARYGNAPSRFNLIHADMRLANLLIDKNGTRLIDFDDSGYGWFMYDFAASISFIEDDPRIPKLKARWLQGYRSVRPLSAEDECEIETFVMLRRMALLAWIGSHSEAPEPQALAAGFAATTARLGQTYLNMQESKL